MRDFSPLSKNKEAGRFTSAETETPEIFADFLMNPNYDRWGFKTRFAKSGDDYKAILLSFIVYAK